MQCGLPCSRVQDGCGLTARRAVRSSDSTHRPRTKLGMTSFSETYRKRLGITQEALASLAQALEGTGAFGLALDCREGVAALAHGDFQTATVLLGRVDATGGELSSESEGGVLS